MLLSDKDFLSKAISESMDKVKITDIHTHLYSPDFGNLLLWGIDELLTYHYLIAETFRYSDISYEGFWGLDKSEQADLIWNTLFIENSPCSEACRGVLTVLSKLGLDVESRDLESVRDYFKSQDVNEYIDRAFHLAGISTAVMTNDPFDDLERPVWLEGYKGDPRFEAVLRIDTLLNAYDSALVNLKAWGYGVDKELSGSAISEIRRFLADWIKRMKPLYMAVSLPPDFRMPDNTARNKIIQECVLPVSKEFNIPFAMMIGVKKLVNPQLRLAGDSVGKGNIETVEYLCSNNPENKFLVTMLSRENQHELAVASRKYRNLMPFGCWWFLNNPSLIDEITRMRFELLGTSFIPQHSDARVLDQVIYKWDHSKKLIAKVLENKYSDMAATGWKITPDEIERDINKLFNRNFRDFLDR